MAPQLGRCVKKTSRSRTQCDNAVLSCTRSNGFRRKVLELMAIKIVIADDHEMVRRGLASLLAGSEIKIVGEATPRSPRAS